MAFFGGLTGVQARQQSAGAQVIAQRIQDAQFHSRFIARADLPLESLEDLKDLAPELTFTFGSESSTSGHLMPRHFLTQAGIDPDNDFRQLANYSGSHDLTWKLVQSGTFDVGVLNEDVWNRAVDQGNVDLSKARSFLVTPGYYDYSWTVPGNLDSTYGSGFTEKMRQALLDLDPEEHAGILELFSTQGFIISENGNYEAIEDVARQLGIVK